MKKRSGLKVIFDSNFFFLPAKFKLDPFEEVSKVTERRIEPIILSVSLQELKHLARHGSPKIRRDAILALKFVDSCQILEVERRSDERADDVILRVASENKIPVATNDSELRRRLRSMGVPVIYLREKSKLEVEGAI